MTGTRADWHVDVDLPEDSDDPLATLGADPEQIGLPINLDGEPRLQARLVELCNQEAALYNKGVRCEIKDSPDTACHACPLFTEDPTDTISALCRVGIAQEKALTELQIVQRGG